MANTFLKWPGGKRWFIKHLPDFLPDNFTYNRYIDPFVGGGSLFFHMHPQNAILADINEELIKTYIAVRDNCQIVKEKVNLLIQQHSEENYYKIRNINYSDINDIAARMIYLNHTCFNGIYRVNKAGKFNVPIGNNNLQFFTSDYLDEKSDLLQGTEIICDNFLNTINKATAGDLLFCDPPYVIKDNENRFRGYTRNLFSWENQLQLKDAIEKAAARGVYILETNVNHSSIYELYETIPNAQLNIIDRYTSISGNKTSRTNYSELIITINI